MIRYSSLASGFAQPAALSRRCRTEIAPSSIDIASHHETTGHFAIGRNDNNDDAAGAKQERLRLPNGPRVALHNRSGEIDATVRDLRTKRERERHLILYRIHVHYRFAILFFTKKFLQNDLSQRNM